MDVSDFMLSNDLQILVPSSCYTASCFFTKTLNYPKKYKGIEAVSVFKISFRYQIDEQLSN